MVEITVTEKDKKTTVLGELGKVPNYNPYTGEEKSKGFGSRVNTGKMDISKEKCPYCGNHKAFEYPNSPTRMGIKKCTKCKKEYR